MFPIFTTLNLLLLHPVKISLLGEVTYFDFKSYLCIRPRILAPWLVIRSACFKSQG